MNLIEVGRLSLNNVTTWSNGDILVANSNIENNDVFLISCGGNMTMTGFGGFVNKAGGKVNKTAGGTNRFDIPFSTSGTFLLNSSVMEFKQSFVQDGGLTDLGLNSWLKISGVQQRYNLNGGVLKGGGEIEGGLTNGGEIRIEDNRTITVTQDYTQLAGGKLSYKQNAGGWGAFKVTGTATLDGTLLVDSAGLPVGAGFNVVEAGTLVGQFSDTSTPGYLVGYDLSGAPKRVFLIPIV